MIYGEDDFWVLWHFLCHSCHLTCLFAINLKHIIYILNWYTSIVSCFASLSIVISATRVKLNQIECFRCSRVQQLFALHRSGWQLAGVILLILGLCTDAQPWKPISQCSDVTEDKRFLRTMCFSTGSLPLFYFTITALTVDHKRTKCLNL